MQVNALAQQNVQQAALQQLAQPQAQQPAPLNATSPELSGLLSQLLQHLSQVKHPPNHLMGESCVSLFGMGLQAILWNDPWGLAAVCRGTLFAANNCSRHMLY